MKRDTALALILHHTSSLTVKWETERKEINNIQALVDTQGVEAAVQTGNTNQRKSIEVGAVVSRIRVYTSTLFAKVHILVIIF